MERLRLLVTSPAAGTEALATNAVELDSFENGHVLASLRPVLYQFDVSGWPDGWEPGEGGVLASRVPHPRGRVALMDRQSCSG